jgi:hypothetical protein
VAARKNAGSHNGGFFGAGLLGIIVDNAGQGLVGWVLVIQA